MPKSQNLLTNNFTNVQELISFLKLDPLAAKKIFKNPSFPLLLPKRLAEKIEKNNISDPIFLQFVPLCLENSSQRGFCEDPTNDKAFQKNSLLKKYANRALLICTSACAMHCRYCFRKNFSYQKTDFALELEEIKKDSSLIEIILSGGDPLMLSNQTLKTLLKKLDSISHIKRIRFHTRALIALPERIDEEFLSILSSIKKQLIFVTHINHKRELDEEVVESIKKIQALKIPILNQSVLLKNINDDLKTLFELNETLSSCGIIPYYLHQLDRVKGSRHFNVSIKKGQKLINELRSITSGYNVPRYIREVPFEKNKIPL